MFRRVLVVLLPALLVADVTTACGAKSRPQLRPAGSGPVTITVPGNAKTIGDAVSAAKPGDLVLIGPGTYKETVNITTAGVTLRGTDRNAVIIDGEVLRPNGVVVTSPGVTLQNFTVRNNTLNGVLITGMSDAGGGLAKGSDGYDRLDPAKFPPLQGFHVDHVTSYNNGLYGIYAFDTQHGLIENTFTSGMADSGLYVGQCKPCHTVVRANVAERNAVGYEGTNAGGDLFVIGNRFVGNRVGATIDSDHQEAFIPQAGATVAGNLIASNNRADTPAQADGGFGIGLGIAGGTQNLLIRNRVEANAAVGLAITSADDLPPLHNRVVSNVFARNKIDLAYTASSRSPGAANCLLGNTLSGTVPARLAQTMACPGSAKPSTGTALPSVSAPPGTAFTEIVAPPPQPNLTISVGPPAAPFASPPAVDLASITVPAASLLADSSAIRW